MYPLPRPHGLRFNVDSTANRFVSKPLRFNVKRLNLLILVSCLGASSLSAAPIGQTISLYHDINASFVRADPDESFQLTAKETNFVGGSEKFLIEDNGNNTIRIKALINGNYVRVNTSNADKLIADTTDSSDPLTHFTWTEIAEGRVELTSVGDPDETLIISPSGVREILRANVSQTSTNTELTWSIVPDLPPNIVMIYIDDWSWCGSSVAMDDRMVNSSFPSIIEMPNLDAIAANGMVFRNAYGSPQCTPARAAIQTGQSNARNGLTVFMGNSDYYDRDSTIEGRQYYHYPVLANGADQTLREEAVTIPEALAPLGYVSAHLGKWHLRGDPGTEGYALHDGATTNSEGNNYTNSGGLEAIVDPKLMTHITDTGMAFMEEQVIAEKPFYLQLSHYAVHGGSECTPESRARYQLIPEVVAFNSGKTNPNNINRKSDPAVWLGMIYELDQKIGQIRDKIEELGIADNTYLIVSGDNGYRHSFFDELTGSPQPLHSRKWWAWQGGIRIPQIIEGPDIPANSYSTTNVANYDFLPTFVDWAGGDPAAIPNLDGLSLAGIMRGESPSDDLRDRGLYFHYPHYRNTMPHSAIVKGGYKVIYFYETPVRFPNWDPIMLFDLNQDGGEFNNIYDEKPELGDSLYNDLSSYLVSVEARIPQVPNPNYDASVYEAADEFGARSGQGPFIGTRGASGDESGPTTFAEYWMNSWGVDIGGDEEDYDGDGKENLLEYATGGDPTNPADRGIPPSLDVSGGSVAYKFFRRNDDSTLTYSAESSTSLDSEEWTPVSTEPEVTSGVSDLDEVAIPVGAGSDRGFFRLKVTKE